MQKQKLMQKPKPKPMQLKAKMTLKRNLLQMQSESRRDAKANRADAKGN
jgi:hypothetical protein